MSVVRRAVDSILYRVSRVVAGPDDPRIASGDLITERQARRLLTADVRRTLTKSKREMEQCVDEAFVQAIRSSGQSNNNQQRSNTRKET